jgi:uncharacterized protein YjiS (DUF1127 family)
MTTQDLTIRNAGWPTRLLAASVGLFSTWRRRRRFNNLLDLDDRLLDDIGVTRAEVEMTSQLPLSQNAATELRRLSLERRRNLM